MIHKNQWRKLYLIGGIAPIITIIFYFSQFFIPLFGYGYPESTEGWFELFQISNLLGLYTLNALDILSIGFLAPMFLALYIQHKKENPSLTAIGGIFALIGIAVFISGRSDDLSILSLSNQYYNTQDPVLQEQLLATGHALAAPVKPTLQTTGFFYISIGMLFFSIVMLNSPQHKKSSGILGITGLILVGIGDLSLLAFPLLAGIMVGVSGLPVLIWWVLISINLLKTAKAIVA